MTRLPSPCHHPRRLAALWRVLRHHAALTVYTACAIALGIATQRSNVLGLDPGLGFYVLGCAFAGLTALALLERQRYLAERAWRKRLERELDLADTAHAHLAEFAGWACKAAGVRFPAVPGEPDPATRQARVRHLLRVARSN